MDKVFITYKCEVTKGEDGTLDVFIPVSSKDVDRTDEVVEPSAFKRTLPKFMKHPVLIAAHNYGELENQIGEWTRLKITDNGLEGKPKYYKGEGNPTADWAYNLASKNRAAFSVGFIPLEYEDGDGDKKPRRTYKQVELLEISQCIIPANRSAVMSMMAKSIDPIVKELCIETLKDLPEEVTKPETTENTVRIPVDSGNHDGHKMRTIQVSKDEGIQALYCVTDKKILTYIFDKEKWDMDKAREWVNSHKSINLEHDISQSEILDELDYLKLMLEESGASDKVKESLQGIASKYLGINITFEKPGLTLDSTKWTGKFYSNGEKIDVKPVDDTTVKEKENIEPTPEEIELAIQNLKF